MRAAARRRSQAADERDVVEPTFPTAPQARVPAPAEVLFSDRASRATAPESAPSRALHAGSASAPRPTISSGRSRRSHRGRIATATKPPMPTYAVPTRPRRAATPPMIAGSASTGIATVTAVVAIVEAPGPTRRRRCGACFVQHPIPNRSSLAAPRERCSRSRRSQLRRPTATSSSHAMRRAHRPQRQVAHRFEQDRDATQPSLASSARPRGQHRDHLRYQQIQRAAP